jgi:hypothetical protein
MVNSARRRLFVTPHALSRMRQHWRYIRHLSDADLCRRVLPKIDKGLKNKLGIETPGGTLVPFSLEGEDAYAVLHGGQVVTVLLKEWCQEAQEIERRNEHNS